MEKQIKRQFNFPIALGAKREDADKGQGRAISGTAIVFNKETELWRDGDTVFREVIAPEAVPESLLRECDIILTMYHNPEKALARSKMGKGTLRWEVDGKGVHFSAEMPETPDGDTALALVGSQVIDGCSFWAYLREEGCTTVRTKEDDLTVYTRTITAFEDIRDFTLTHSPAYPQTTVGVEREAGSAQADKEAFLASEREREAGERAAREASYAEVRGIISGYDER